MARYIDAEILKRNIRVNLMPNVDVDGTVTVEVAERYFLNLIEKTSTADVEEVARGEWKRQKQGFYFICSVCGKASATKGNYCHDCGARMDKGSTQ